MTRTHSNRHQAAGNTKKVMRHLAIAFFLCTLSVHAQSNIVTETAYGTDQYFWATTNSISSMTNGAGDLTVRFSGTSDLTLTHQIAGSIDIQNDFADLTLTATGATVSNWQGVAGTPKDAVLYIENGTNLTLTGGSYIGIQGTDTNSFPPIPGQGTQYVYSTNAAMGGYIRNVQTGTISNTRFDGATYAATEEQIVGTDALEIDTIGSLTISGTNSTFIGGNGGDVYSSSDNTHSAGGTALKITDSAVTISNGTFSGGSSGDAVSDDGFSLSYGGDGLYATNSALTIHSGTFTGGDAGSATTNYGGLGLFAVNSDITIDGGTFAGGSYGTATAYSFYSRATANETNKVELSDGTFDQVGFDGDGVQYLTASGSLIVSDGIVQNGGTLMITNGIDSPFQTTIINAGTMHFANNFTLADHGSFYLAGDDSFATFDGSFSNAAGAALWIAIDSASNGLLKAQTVHFESNSTLGIVNNLPALQSGTSVTTEVIKATSGIFVDGTLATTNDLTNKVNIAGLEEGRTGLAGIMLDNNTNNLSLRFATKTLREYWSATGAFATLLDELDDLSGLNSNFLAQIDEIADPDISGPLVEQTYFTTFNTFQSALQGFQLATGQSSSRNSQFRQQLKLTPPGAKGPTRNNELRGWIRYYGQFRQHDSAGLNPKYKTTLHGGMVGIDKSLGNLLLGISGGAGHYTTTYDTDAEERITAFNGSLYGTYGMDSAYIDFGVGYGHNQVDSQTAEPFVLEGEFDAQVFGGHIGAGIDLADETEGMVFTPEISIHYATYEQDAYTETGEAAIPRQIDAFEADSLYSSVGLNLSTQNKQALETFSFQYDVRLHWQHEYNPEPGTMNFQIAGGNGTTYRFEHPLLDEDVFRVGLGASFFNTKRNQPKNVLFRIDYDALLGDGFNAHNLSGKVLYAF